MVRNTGASSAGGAGSGRSALGRTTKSVNVTAAGRASRRAASTAPSSTSAVAASSALIWSSATPAARSTASWTSSGSTRAPLLHLVRGPVPLGITLVVAVPAVRRRLHDGGAASVARRADDVRHDRRRRDDVVPVHRHVRDAVAGCPELE